MYFRGIFIFVCQIFYVIIADNSTKRMSYSDATISQSRLLSCFQDRNNDFFRVSHIEPEEGDSAMPLSFCHSTFIPERYWPVASKMCADYLAVWKIRVNTQSPRASIYKLFLNYQSLTEILFLKKSLFCPFLSVHLYAAPTGRGCASLYPSAKYAGTWSARVHILRRCAFFYTSIIISIQI